MTVEFTARDAPTTAEENKDHPFPSAATGSACKSAKVGAAADDSPKEGWEEDEGAGAGSGVFPKPA